MKVIHFAQCEAIENTRRNNFWSRQPVHWLNETRLTVPDFRCFERKVSPARRSWSLTIQLSRLVCHASILYRLEPAILQFSTLQGFRFTHFVARRGALSSFADFSDNPPRRGRAICQLQAGVSHGWRRLSRACVIAANLRCKLQVKPNILRC